MFLNRIEKDKIQEDVFENIKEGEILENVFRNNNIDAFYWGNDVYDIEQVALRKGLENLIGGLKKREQEVLRMRYGFDDGVEKTLEEVGKMFGVTRERIRQIEAKAIKKLLQSRRKRKLKDFL